MAMRAAVQRLVRDRGIGFILGGLYAVLFIWVAGSTAQLCGLTLNFFNPSVSCTQLASCGIHVFYLTVYLGLSEATCKDR